MSSLVPRFPPSWQYVLPANDGKLDGGWGNRLVISDSVYKLSCAYMPQAENPNATLPFSQ